MTDQDAAGVEEPFPPGTRVEVRSRFEDTWSGGFEVAGREGDLYRLRRLSDRAELPTLTSSEDFRRERRRETWWI